MKLVDRNVRGHEAEWNWAELVVISGMIVQKDDMQVQIGRSEASLSSCSRWGALRQLNT